MPNKKKTPAPVKSKSSAPQQKGRLVIACPLKKGKESTDEGVKYLWGFSGILGNLWEFQFNCSLVVVYDMTCLNYLILLCLL